MFSVAFLLAQKEVVGWLQKEGYVRKCSIFQSSIDDIKLLMERRQMLFIKKYMVRCKCSFPKARHPVRLTGCHCEVTNSHKSTGFQQWLGIGNGLPPIRNHQLAS